MEGENPFADSFYKPFTHAEEDRILNQILWYMFLKTAKTIEEATDNIKKYWFSTDTNSSFLCNVFSDKKQYGGYEAMEYEDLTESDSQLKLFQKYIKQEWDVDIYIVKHKHSTKLSFNIIGRPPFSIKIWFSIGIGLPLVLKHLFDFPPDITREFLLPKDKNYECLYKLYTAIQKEEDRLNITSVRKRNSFRNYATSIMDKKKQEIDFHIMGAEEDLKRVLDTARKMTRDIWDLKLQRAAYDNYNLDKTVEQLQIFFEGRPNISINMTDGDGLRYIVFETLNFWNSDILQGALECRVMEPDIRYCMEKIFVNYKGEVCVYASFDMSDLSKISPHYNSILCVHGHIRHPHLATYQCLGENESYMLEYLAQGKWDCAIEQTVAATKNINFGDASPINAFINDLTTARDKNFKVILYKGIKYTVSEFCKIMREEDKNGFKS